MKKILNRRKILFIITLIILLASVYTSYLQKIKVKQLEGERIILEQTIEELKDRKNKILKELQGADSLEFIEKTARGKLKMVKPNEILFIIND